jgi:4-amino-4-deoxy-L-arabinose transferase-like glycosyltransferase
MIKKYLINLKSSDLLIILVLIFLNTLPRLTYFFNPGFFIDGDEAFFGTMIKELLNNGHIPLFFYGQNYALVFPEVLLGASISLVLGANIIGMKTAMLILWLISIVVIYYIGKKIFLSRHLAFLSTMFFSSIPAWFDWSTKARGGYLTSFLLSNIIILLTLYKRSNGKILAISAFLVIIYYAQPLWLIMLIPFIAYYFLKNYKFKQNILLPVSFLILLAMSHFILLVSNIKYQNPNKLGLGKFIYNAENIFNNYYVAHSGKFFDAAVLKMNHLVSLNSLVFVTILLIVIIYNIYLIINKKIKKIALVFLLSIFFYTLFILFSNEQAFSYRYLLPVFMPSVFLIIITVNNLLNKKLKNLLYLFLVCYSILSLICSSLFYNYLFPKMDDGYTEVERIEYLGTFLNKNNIKCVYALDWMISQHINYFMPEIKTRHQTIDTRRTEDSSIVDSMLQQKNNCALVGLWYHASLFANLYNFNDIIIIDNRYIVYLHPQKNDLLKLNFELTSK